MEANLVTFRQPEQKGKALLNDDSLGTSNVQEVNFLSYFLFQFERGGLKVQR